MIDTYNDLHWNTRLLDLLHQEPHYKKLLDKSQRLPTHLETNANYIIWTYLYILLSSDPTGVGFPCIVAM